ncbi:polysaccharide deacetylase family protein [Cognatitamlana onchidii]|uniref:polysaccharide deacetylase family protein n=1 Tax=Cognatitamlana onchidii TaxID=2562860 RepID=UPI0010A60F25|nr:polysaccharide deacetylase family protein [Algibacter onchidii]
MRFVPAKTPPLIKAMFPNYIWNMPAKEKTIYLTFDDGPTPEITNWTLNTLKQYQAKATFFCIGANIEKHPDIFSNILASGHKIGNHTYNHIKGWQTKTKPYLENIAMSQEIMDNLLPNPKDKFGRLFRPPYGQIKRKQGKKLIDLGYKIVMWNVLSFDWDAATSPETCLKHIISKANSGSIIVFHDSVKASKKMMYALPKTLEYFSTKGYSFKSIV